MAVRALLQGQPFPGGRGGGKMRFERHDSETQGYLTVRGLPWDVTPEEVKAFFEVGGSTQRAIVAFLSPFGLE
jgi:hypothetical protein